MLWAGSCSHSQWKLIMLRVAVCLRMALILQGTWSHYRIEQINMSPFAVIPVQNMNLLIWAKHLSTKISHFWTFLIKTQVKASFRAHGLFRLPPYSTFDYIYVFDSSARQLTVQMMQNPQILAALQERLDGLNGSPSGYMERWDMVYFLVTT